MSDKTSLVPDSTYGGIRIESRRKGWPRAGFTLSTTQLLVRRIPDCVQIEVSICEVKGEKERIFTKCGSVTLSFEQTEQLITALRGA